MRFWDRWLGSWITGAVKALTKRLYELAVANEISKATNELEQGHVVAYRVGALWSALDLLKNNKRLIVSTEALEQRAKESGLAFDLHHPEAQKRLEAQQAVAGKRFEQGLIIQPAEIIAPRAANYATRWSLQQGIADIAEYSEFLRDGEPQEVIKEWLRIASRRQHRAWHDALNGQRIKYSELFTLVTPRGTFRIDRPYSSNLPIGEKIHCGHGIRLIIPGQVDTFVPWNGQAHDPSIRGREQPNNPPAKARSNGLQPQGVKVSDSIGIPDNLPFKEVVSEALKAIDAVHGLGWADYLGSTRIQAVGRIPQGGAAAYDASTVSVGKIEVLKRGGWSKLDIVHEVGHMLHHQLVGKPEQYPSVSQNERLRIWRDAVSETPTIKKLKAALAAPGVTESIGGKRLFIPTEGRNRQDLEYLLRPSEAFARSYAQYIAVSSGDAEMLAELGRMRQGPGDQRWYNWSWQDDEFEDLARVFDHLLKERGWSQ